MFCNWVFLGPDTQDADSDEEWPALGQAGADEVEFDTEVVVDRS